MELFKSLLKFGSLSIATILLNVLFFAVGALVIMFVWNSVFASLLFGVHSMDITHAMLLWLGVSVLREEPLLFLHKKEN